MPDSAAVRKPPIRIGVPVLTQPRPQWLKVRWSNGERLQSLERELRARNLHTVCEEALCPNRSECWGRGVATVLIMGDVCTRRCGFCAIGKGRPAALDPAEPQAMADLAEIMGARYLVITSVDRDDLPDGGAAHFGARVRAVLERTGALAETLIP
ncbi:MAG: lipoyl synthase, partial [Chloroflexi bacterium]|nr:lipoyl synthase [Chloroflexota bacterium]